MSKMICVLMSKPSVSLISECFVHASLMIYLKV